MKSELLNFVPNVINSLKKGEGGFSGRKLTALTFTAFAGYLHKTQLNDSNATTFLLIDCMVVLLCLSIVTFEQVIKFKNGINNDNPPADADQPK